MSCRVVTVPLVMFTIALRVVAAASLSVPCTLALPAVSWLIYFFAGRIFEGHQLASLFQTAA